MSDGTWYCSPQGSDSTGAGTLASPWRQPQHAIDTVNAGAGLQDGDTIVLAPGVYEDFDWDVDSVGSPPTLGDEAFVLGDANLEYAWTQGEQPGQIYVTVDSVGDGTGVPTSTSPIVDWAGCNHAHVINVNVEGSTAVGFEGDSTLNNQKCIGCKGMVSSVGGSDGAFVALHCEFCVGVGGRYGFRLCGSGGNGSLKWCVAIGPHPARDCDADISWAFGGGFGWYGGTLKNCGAVGAEFGLFDDSFPTPPANCFVLGAGDGNVGTSVPAGCMFVACTDAIANAIDASVSREIYSQGSTGTVGAGHCLDFPPARQVIEHVARAFQLVKWNDWDMADAGTPSTLKDLEGRSRTASGRAHIGAQSVCRRTILQDATNGETVRIDREGEEVFYINLAGGVSRTITVDFDCSLGAGSEYPRIDLLDKNFTVLDYDVATGTSGTLSVTHQPTHDMRARLVVRAMEDDSGAYARFWDPAVT